MSVFFLTLTRTPGKKVYCPGAPEGRDGGATDQLGGH